MPTADCAVVKKWRLQIAPSQVKSCIVGEGFEMTRPEWTKTKPHTLFRPKLVNLHLLGHLGSLDGLWTILACGHDALCRQGKRILTSRSRPVPLVRPPTPRWRTRTPLGRGRRWWSPRSPSKRGTSTTPLSTWSAGCLEGAFKQHLLLVVRVLWHSRHELFQDLRQPIKVGQPPLHSVSKVEKTVFGWGISYFFGLVVRSNIFWILQQNQNRNICRCWVFC